MIVAKQGASAAAFARRKDTELVAPDNAFQVLHDWQLEEFGYMPRQLNPGYEQRVAVPSTRRTDGFGSFPLSKEHQFFWYELLLWNVDGLLGDEAVKEIWVRLTAHNMAFTDGHSREQGYRDFITGANPNGSPIEISGIVCTGNVIQQVFAGDRYRHFEAIDLTQPPPKEYEPHLIQWCTEQTLDRRGDQWAVSRFPHFKNWLGVSFGVPLPVYGVGNTNKIKIEFAERIAGKYSPYVG